MTARLMEEEGITNVFQRDSVKCKSRDSQLERYGVEHNSSMPRPGRQNTSKIHVKTLEFLRSSGFPCKPEFTITYMEESSGFKRYRAYDIWIIGTKKLIEVNGDYWHANPSKYKKSDIIQYGTSTYRTSEEIWDRDSKKLELATSMGYEVLSVWEQDIITDWDSVTAIILKFVTEAK
jgi:G:T-mismatch repair DNA endonuclease (very short patch repair protein)